jgi:hypothetical protein
MFNIYDNNIFTNAVFLKLQDTESYFFFIKNKFSTFLKRTFLDIWCL